MQPNRLALRTLALSGAAVALTFASCSLPPREAWHRIQTEGLISFLAHESPPQPAATPATPAPARKTVPAIATATRPDYAGPPKPVADAEPTPAPAAAAPPAPKPSPAPVAATSPAPAPPKPAATPAPIAPKTASAPSTPVTAGTNHNLMPPPSKNKALTAFAVPSLPGFVRSPYTVPPRLVDAKGASPGSTMICPYTQRPFIVPADFVNPPASSGATALNIPPPPPALPASTSTSPAPAVAKQTKPTAATPVSNPPAAHLFKNDSPPAPGQANDGSATAAASSAPAKAATPEIPYAMPIPGRPGFVNSPFAAKHQLVDVTGLPVGMEVKCPYTGKLFRVPAQDIAQQKALAAPGAPAVSDKPEKK